MTLIKPVSIKHKITLTLGKIGLETGQQRQLDKPLKNLKKKLGQDLQMKREGTSAPRRNT